MIYLIGGPPKCGKTTLAKKLSKKLNIPFVSSDTLEVVAMEYVWKYAPDKFDSIYPHSASKGKNNDETYSKISPEQISKNYIKQAKATYSAVDSFSICEISDGNDYIIEGYHVTPQLVASLSKKYGNEKFKVIFLVKTDTSKFLEDIKNSSTPNDWILTKTKNTETFHKIAEMVSFLGQFFQKEGEKYNHLVLEMDHDFDGQIKQALEVLSK